jgi:S-DNA-T family DNA segregation ATPase FtsK/SpoIIIE
VGFEPAGTFLLAGPPRSGRTNALRWLVTSLARAHPTTRFVYLGGRRSSLAGLDLWNRAATGAAAAAETARAALADVAGTPAQGRTVVVLEATTDFLSGGAELAVTELVRAARRNEHLVLAEAETSAWASSWPLVAEIRAGRRGLVLQPDQAEGDALFRTSFPRLSRTEFPVGRGVLVDRATVRRVQMPLLARADAAPPTRARLSEGGYKSPWKG